MGAISGFDLISGPFPVLVGSLACVAGAFLLLFRRRRWVLYFGACAVLAAAGAWAINWYLVTLSGITAHDLPLQVIWWIGAGVLAVLLMARNLVFGGRWRKLLAPVAMAVIMLTVVVQINLYFDIYRTIGDVTGASTAAIAPLAPSTANPSKDSSPADPAGAPVIDHWVQPPGLPTHGTVNSVRIPGNVSGFIGRPGYVYLPPAYQAASHPLLPVLVLVPGQPGSPADWLRAGQLQPVMDAFASAHHGLAPVVVVPDVNGSSSANTMCMDSGIAKTDTYLSVDVPAWIKTTLTVDPDPGHWAIGGFSFGGTCALQMAALHPRTYPSAIDLSGEAEPALFASRTATIQAAFGGNTAAFDARTPLHVMAKTRYPDSWIYFAAGGQDRLFTGYTNEVAGAAKAAGMTVSTHTVADVGHSWAVTLYATGPALTWLAQRLGLAR